MSFSNSHSSNGYSPHGHPSQRYSPGRRSSGSHSSGSHASEVSSRSQLTSNAVGRPKVVTEAYLQRLKELVSHDPRRVGYPFRRWTADWLNRHLSQEYSISISNRHINRLLKQMGLSTRTAYAASPQDWLPPASRITINDLPIEASSEASPGEDFSPPLDSCQVRQSINRGGVSAS